MTTSNFGAGAEHFFLNFFYYLFIYLFLQFEAKKCSFSLNQCRGDQEMCQGALFTQCGLSSCSLVLVYLLIVL